MDSTSRTAWQQAVSLTNHRTHTHLNQREYNKMQSQNTIQQRNYTHVCFSKVHCIIFDQLNLIGVLKTPSFGGGGVESTPPPIFICENNRKSNKIMHSVFFLLVVLKI